MKNPIRNERPTPIAAIERRIGIGRTLITDAPEANGMAIGEARRTTRKRRPYARRWAKRVATGRRSVRKLRYARAS